MPKRGREREDPQSATAGPNRRGPGGGRVAEAAQREGPGPDGYPIGSVEFRTPAGEPQGYRYEDEGKFITKHLNNGLRQKNNEAKTQINNM